MSSFQWIDDISNNQQSSGSRAYIIVFIVVAAFH